jgi:hypothetical protein
MRLEVWQRPPYLKTFISGGKKNNKILRIREVASLLFMKGEKSAEQGRVVYGFQNGCDKHQNNHQTNKLKLMHEQLKNVYKCPLPLTTT